MYPDPWENVSRGQGCEIDDTVNCNNEAINTDNLEDDKTNLT